MTRNNNDTSEDKRIGTIVVGVLQLVFSICGFVVGVLVYSSTKNVQAGAFWPHCTLFVSAVLFLIGSSRRCKGKPWLTAGSIFCGFGIFMSLIGAIVDGVQGRHVLETEFDRCIYYKYGGHESCDNGYYKALTKLCRIKYPPRSCVCCYLYRKHFPLFPFSLSTKPSVYERVPSCSYVSHRFQDMLWASTALCLANLICGTIEIILVYVYKSTVLNNRTVFPSSVPINADRRCPGRCHVSTAVHGPVIFYGNQCVGYSRSCDEMTPVGVTSPPPPYSTDDPEFQASANPVAQSRPCNWYMDEKPPAYSQT